MPRQRKDYTGERHGHLVIQETVGYNKNGRPLVRCLCDCGRDVVRDYYSLGPVSRCSTWNHEILGKRFGHLVVEDFDHIDSCGNACFKCHCDCGRETVHRGTSRNSTSSCANWNHEILGKRFGRLVVEDFDHIDKNGKALFRCLCDCGNETFVFSASLTQGNTKSCGCLRSDNVVLALSAQAHVDGTYLDRLSSTPYISNTSGVRGVYFNRRKGLWQAHIKVANRRYFLGSFRNLEHAAAARREAEQIIFDPILLRNGKAPTDGEWHQRVAEAVKALRERNRGDGMTAKEAAETAHVSKSAFLRALSSGQVRGEKVGGRWVIHPENLAEWMRTRSDVQH